MATIFDEVILKVDNCYLDECLADETYVKGEDTRYHFDITRLQPYPWLLKDNFFQKQVGRNIFSVLIAEFFRS